MACSSTRPHRKLNVPTVQNFHLVWLDESIDEVNNDDCHNSITILRQVINTVNTFTDVDECIDFITDIKWGTTFMMVSDSFSQIIVSMVQDISLVDSVYIYCENTVPYEICAQQWSKVKGVYTNIISICEALKKAVQNCDHNSVSISFVKKADRASKDNLDQLDSSFMHTQILKEILLTIDFEQVHINEFLTYCREQFFENSSELKIVDKIEKEYFHHEPIWWYTYQCFLYSMLNRALCTMEVDLIIKMGFFVRDLHNHIAALHVEQYDGRHHSNSLIVYRGQGLSQIDFDQLKNTQDGLMSFNNFLSASLDQQVSLAFAESNQYNPDRIGVLFQITIVSSIPPTYFASIRDVSACQIEEEILFSMHSVFRIGQVKQIDGNNGLWQVDLTLTSDNDPQLDRLTELMRKETEGSTGWDRLGQLMIKLNQFNKAEELYEILLEESTDEDEKAYLFHMLGVVKDGQGNYAEAIQFYEKALEINQKTLPVNYPYLATSYNNIGMVYYNMGQYSKALSYHEQAHEIEQKTLPANHHYLATSYNNTGMVYYNMGQYLKALSYFEKALEIEQKSLPINHPSLAISYNNIGGVYNNMNEYSKALLYYENALEIQQKTLPVNHPLLSTSYNNIGAVYYSVEEYSKALSYFEKALEIYQKTLSANDPHFATSYTNIGIVYRNTGEYLKALSYYEKALEIEQKTLPVNHPSLAISYNNIGTVCENMDEYWIALSYHKKALEIQRKSLPANHPLLATSYNNIGGVYDQTGEYSKALSYYKKALEIEQKHLPANYSNLTTSYDNIAAVYYKMDEYSKALSCFKKVLKISRKTLSENDPHLTTSYNNIGAVYNNMGEYLKALLYHEKALEIQQKTLPANHSNFTQSYNNIASLYENMEEHSKALSYFERAQNILQCSLPSDHPHAQSVRESIERVKKKL